MKLNVIESRQRMTEIVNTTINELAKVMSFYAEVYFNMKNEKHTLKECISDIIYASGMNGFCWHVATIVKEQMALLGVSVKLYLCAPFGHIVFKIDGDDKYFDIEGEYVGDAYYFIPIEEYLCPSEIMTFATIPNSTAGSVEDCINVMKRYCKDNNIKYDPSCEKFLEKEVIKNFNL